MIKNIKTINKIILLLWKHHIEMKIAFITHYYLMCRPLLSITA